MWLLQLMRASIFFMADARMNGRCKRLMDVLMRRCFGAKYMRPTDTLFHEKDHQNLEMLVHLLQHYAHPAKVEYAPKLRWKHMVPLMLKNKAAHNEEYGKYMARLLRLPVVGLTMTANEAYHALLTYLHLANVDEEAPLDLQGDGIVMALVALQRRQGNSHHSHLWPQNALAHSEDTRQCDG